VLIAKSLEEKAFCLLSTKKIPALNKDKGKSDLGCMIYDLRFESKILPKSEIRNQKS
jgi:hypothetical protein